MIIPLVKIIPIPMIIPYGTHGRGVWGVPKGTKGPKGVLQDKMPRFSDVFVWVGTVTNGGIVEFYDCRLLKRIGRHEKGTHFPRVVFDIVGMYVMMYESDGGVHGPYCLTVVE